MNDNNRTCWLCLWHRVVGSHSDPIPVCGHTCRQIRNNFNGSTTACSCERYLEDDPSMKIQVVRDTREMLMKGIRQIVMDSGQLAAAEPILDYFSPNTYAKPKEITCDDFCFGAEVQFGGSEGIYLDCYAEGRIQPEGPDKRWDLGTYKTLETSLAAMQIFGALGGALIYYGREYLMENSERFLSDRELRVRYLKERQKAEEARAK